MYLGLDLSLTHTGWCLLDSKGKLKKSGVKESKLKGVERLAEYELFIKNIIKQYNFQYAGIEDHAFRGYHLASTGELHGVIKVNLFNNKKVSYNISPLTVKKFILGSAKKTEKDIMLLQVYKKYGYSFDTSHECDAFGLAYMVYCFVNKDKLKLNKNELERLAKIKKI